LKLSLFPSIAIIAAVALAQTPPAAAPAPAAAPKRTAPKAVSPVDSVIQLVKGGMSDDLIIRSLKKTNKPVDLSTADMVKLKQAGVSDNVIGVLLDPTSVPAPAAAVPVAATVAPAPAPEPAPVAASVAPAPAAPGPTSQADKKRVIVDEFDYSTVKSSVQAVFNTQADIGKGIRAMLVKRMADANKVVIVERAKIDQLTSEQDRNVSNRVKQGSGARVGRISGADAVLAGDIVVFGRDDKKTNIGGGALARGPFAGLHIKKEDDKAVVVIDYRLVDAETSEVIATGEARGESNRKSSGFSGMGGNWGGAGGGGVDMTSSNFGQTIIGEATQDCVNKLGEILSAQATSMKKTVREVETRVADVSGSTMVIAAGANDGVNVGETFEILKVLREVKDPQTKEVLDTVTEKAGDMTVTSVRDKIATGTYVGKPAAVGFIARKKLPQ
jgi:curli biogenesis system outer membrane secretion channel CsgG